MLRLRRERAAGEIQDVRCRRRSSTERVALKPIRQFLSGWFGGSALYYAVSRLLWPADDSPLAAVVKAALWGLIMEVPLNHRVGLLQQEEKPYPPTFHFLSGLFGLVACAVFWRSIAPGRTSGELFGLLGGILISLCLLVSAFVTARRNRAQGVASGT